LEFYVCDGEVRRVSNFFCGRGEDESALTEKKKEEKNKEK